MKNLLFVDSMVSEYELFVNSANADTMTYVYRYTTTRNDILDFLRDTKIERIGIVFIMGNSFLNGHSFFTEENIDFLVSLIQTLDVKNIDYLACDTLQNSEWIHYYSKISETGVIVGASNNQTGNIKYGGDWILESTGQDIERIYFTENIEYYQYLLDNVPASYAIDSSMNLYLTGTIYGVTNSQRNTFIKIEEIQNVLYCHYSNNSFFVITSDYNLYCSGVNSQGMLGRGTVFTERVSYANALINATTPLTNIVSVSSYQQSTMAIDKSGDLWYAGQSERGSFGLNTAAEVSVPYFTKQTLISFKVKSVARGVGFSIVVDASSNLWGTGINTTGQLGSGNLLQQTTYQKCKFSAFPGYLTGVSKVVISNENFTQGRGSTIALKSDGTVWVCGYNHVGQLGCGDYTQRTYFTQAITALAVDNLPVVYLKNITAIASGGTFVLALDSSGNVWATGNNGNGQFGNGNTLSSNLFIKVINTQNVISMQCGPQHSFFLYSDNTLATVGRNEKGQLGNGFIDTDGSITLQPIILPDIKMVSLSNPLQIINTMSTYSLMQSTSSANLTSISYYKTNNFDFTKVFYPYSGGTKASLTGYTVNGVDLNSLYNPIQSGETEQIINYKSNDVDLGSIFSPYTPTYYPRPFINASTGLPTSISDTVYNMIDIEDDIYIIGNFSLIDISGITCNCIARWNLTTSAWYSLGPGRTFPGNTNVSGPNGTCFAIAKYLDPQTGKYILFVGGRFTALRGDISCNSIAKWDGTTWSALIYQDYNGIKQGQNQGAVYNLKINKNILYVGGVFNSAGGNSYTNIVSWNITDSTWNGLSTGLNGACYSMIVYNDILYATGVFTTAGGNPCNYIARWNTIDLSWNNLSTGLVVTSTVVADKGTASVITGYLSQYMELATDQTYIYVTGQFSSAGGISCNNVARWNINAQRWSNLENGLLYAGMNINSMAYFDRNLYICGSYNKAGGSLWTFCIAWNGVSWKGSMLPDYVNVFFYALYAYNNRMLVGGRYNAPYQNVNTNDQQILLNRMSILEDSLLKYYSKPEITDASYGMTLGTVYASAIYKGELYLGGPGFKYSKDNITYYLIKWDGSSFSPIKSLHGVCNALETDGTYLYVGGNFNTVPNSSNPAPGLVRWDGVNWSSPFFIRVDRYVLRMQYESNLTGTRCTALKIRNNILYVAGKFYYRNAQDALIVDKEMVAAWDLSSTANQNPNTSVWINLGSPGDITLNQKGTCLSGTCNYMYVEGNYLYATGEAGMTYDGFNTNYIARWNLTTLAWSQLGTGLNGPGRAIASDGSRLFVGGTFTTAGGNSCSRIAQWDGTNWSALSDGTADGILYSTSASLTVCEFLFIENGLLYVAGSFTKAGKVVAYNIATWNINNAVWTNVDVGLNGRCDFIIKYNNKIHIMGPFTQYNEVGTNSIIQIS